MPDGQGIYTNQNGEIKVGRCEKGKFIVDSND